MIRQNLHLHIERNEPMNTLQLKQLLRNTPVNMRRLVNQLHHDGFAVEQAGNWGNPIVVIRGTGPHDGEALGKALARYGVKSSDWHINMRGRFNPDGSCAGEIHLLLCTDDDFTGLPPITIDLSFTNAQIEAAARAAHEVNRSYCEAMGDTSQKPWAEAPNWQCQSALEGVRAVIDGKTPEQLHESWMLSKISDGWRYGEVKDAEAKTHPCIVPYDELPEFQRRKDELFRGTVRAVLGLTD